MHFGLKRSWPFPLLIGGGIVGYLYWPTGVGLAASMLSLLLFLPLALVSVRDMLRANKGRPVPTFFETTFAPPRSLFTGRIPNSLDTVAHTAAALFGVLLVLGGLGLLIYNLILVVITLVSRGAWLPLSVVAFVTLAVGFHLWRSSAVGRSTTLAVLALLALATSPIVERTLR